MFGLFAVFRITNLKQAANARFQILYFKDVPRASFAALICVNVSKTSSYLPLSYSIFRINKYDGFSSNSSFNLGSL